MRLVPHLLPRPLAVCVAALAMTLAATRRVQRGRVELTTTLTGLDDAPDPPPGGRVTVAVHRVAFDRPAGRVAVETELADATGGDAGGRSAPTRLVAVGDVVYARMAPAASAGRAPPGWVELDRAALAAQGPDSDAARLVLDPLASFGVVDDAMGDAATVEVVGQGRVRGTAVTHVAVRPDGAATADGAVPLDVWIDADDVIRRLELRVAAGPAASGELVTRVELFDVGAEVDIRPPEEGPTSR